MSITYLTITILSTVKNFLEIAARYSAKWFTISSDLFYFFPYLQYCVLIVAGLVFVSINLCLYPQRIELSFPDILVAWRASDSL